MPEDRRPTIKENVTEPRAPLKIAPVRLPKSLRWVFLIGGVLLAALLLVSYLHPYMTERIKFFTGNALNLLLLVVIVVQSIIYRRQWAVMEEQNSAMKGQLDVIENQADIMSGQRDVMLRGLDTSILQAQIMRDSLEETKNMVKFNEAMVNAMQGQLVAMEKAVDAAYVAQRAYIGIADLRMQCQAVGATAPVVVGAIPTLHVTWRNGGTTPARNFRAVPYLAYGDKPEWRGYFLDDDDSDIKGSFLPAGKEVTIEYPQAETGFKPFTKQMADDLASGKKRLYAMVLGFYIDHAGKTRRFETGAIWKPYDGGFTELHEYNKQE